MLSDVRGLQHADSHEFSNINCKDEKFTLDEAEHAIEVMGAFKEGSHRNSWLDDMSINSLKILLGLALCNEHETLFNQVTSVLGPNHIKPFNDNYKQAKRGYSKIVLYLFELALKAAIIGSDMKQVSVVISFSKSYNYLCTLDE